MDKPFALVYELVQQSPLIHFQYYQSGATLRATEVKPKLDRYLMKRLKADKVKVEKNWLIADTDAFDYKMRFSSVPFQTVDLGYKTPYDIYYGNMGTNAKKMKGVQYTANIKMTIICLKEPLRNAIKKYISDFFIVSNFGRMQNKGFGSFIIEQNQKLTAKQIGEALRREYGAKKCYSFEVNKEPFRYIKIVYSLMKSGINFSGYRRSILFEYMHSMKTGNEKAYLKRKRVAPAVGRHSQHDKNQNDEVNYYVRALLGTGDHLDFLNKPTDPSRRKDKTKISISNGEIDRFASTIFFKIIGNRVYYVGKRINEVIFGKQFTFKVTDSESYTPAEYSIPISTPPKNDKFNENFMDDFLAYCYTELRETNPKNGGKSLDAFCWSQKMDPIRIEEV